MATDAQASRAAIEEFWGWWPTEQSRIAGVFNGDPEAAAGLVIDDLVPLVAPRVKTINPDLEREFGPGISGSRHRLTVSPGGIPSARSAVRRWLNMAPQPDATWSFTDAKPPRPGTPSNIGHFVFDPNEARIGVAQGQTILDIELWHPNFTGGEQDERAAYAMLDLEVGEPAVSMWLARIKVVATQPHNSVDFRELRDMIKGLQRSSVDDSGLPSWQIYSIENNQGPGAVRVITGLSPVAFPACDHHVRISFGVDPQRVNNVGDGEIMQRLNTLEDQLETAVRDHGVGVFVGSLTQAGEVVKHFYLDSWHPDFPVALDQLKTIASTWDGGPHDVVDEADPGWEAVRDYRA